MQFQIVTDIEDTTDGAKGLSEQDTSFDEGKTRSPALELKADGKKHYCLYRRYASVKLCNRKKNIKKESELTSFLSNVSSSPFMVPR